MGCLCRSPPLPPRSSGYFRDRDHANDHDEGPIKPVAPYKTRQAPEDFRLLAETE
jgi:hypothetical protein